MNGCSLYKIDNFLFFQCPTPIFTTNILIFMCKNIILLILSQSINCIIFNQTKYFDFNFNAVVLESSICTYSKHSSNSLRWVHQQLCPMPIFIDFRPVRKKTKKVNLKQVKIRNRYLKDLLIISHDSSSISLYFS